MASDKTDESDKKPTFFRRLFGLGPKPVEAPAEIAPPEIASPEISSPEITSPDAKPPEPEASPRADTVPLEPVAEAVVPMAPVAPEPPVLPEPPVVPDPVVAPDPEETRPPDEAIAEAVVDAIAAASGADFLMAAPEPEPEPPVVAAPEKKRSWWTRLTEGLSRSSSAIGTGIADIFTKSKLDDAMLEDLEDVLIRADLGVAMATRIAEAIGKGRYDRQVSPAEVKAILASEVERVLAPLARPIDIAPAIKPFVILVVGVNGSGKTTTIGKLAAKLSAEGKRVTLAAGDTFRAAAIAQLQIWGDRLGCTVIARDQGSDAASLAYEAIEASRAAGADVMLMDTAGRLQNRAELMAELEKIIRVMRKVDVSAPHAVLLVLDATVGQNAMNQVEVFGKVAGVTGLVMTKLDGTARGGILVAIAEKFKLPIHFVGVGETAEDLEPFSAKDFAEAIAGIERAG